MDQALSSTDAEREQQVGAATLHCELSLWGHEAENAETLLSYGRDNRSPADTTQALEAQELRRRETTSLPSCALSPFLRRTMSPTPSHSRPREHVGHQLLCRLNC